MLHGPTYSLTELVGFGTLSEEALVVLRYGLEMGASLFVAAGPQGAGKSTLATALLECLPDDAQVYVTAGPRDPLAVPKDGGPVYLLVNELSWHMPLYLHGPAAQRAFALLNEGIRMVGTVHATSVAGVLQAICDEAEIEAIGAPMLVAIVQRRRVIEIGLLAPDATALANGQPLQVRADAMRVLDEALGHVR